MVNTVLSRAMYQFWRDPELDVICHSRVVNCLKTTLWNANIKTFEDLCQHTEEEIMEIKYVGAESMKFLRRFMQHQYLSFKRIDL